MDLKDTSNGSLKARTCGLGVLSMVLGILSPIIPYMLGILDVWFMTTGVLGLGLGISALVKIAKSKGRLAGRFFAYLGIITCSAWIGLIGLRIIVPAVVDSFKLANRTCTFEGDCDQLKQTVIIPTLETAAPKGKNIIWCLPFQLAWNRLKDNIITEPVKLTDANEIAERLNTASQSAADICKDDYYAASGFVKDGIIEQIRTEMSQHFPSQTMHDFEVASPDGVVAYAYLRANVKFTTPFKNNPDELLFTDSRRNETPVASFGAWSGFGSVYGKMREQVQVLYYTDTRDEETGELIRTEFALDLCRHTSPYRIVVAVTETKGTLEKTLSDLEDKIQRYSADGYMGPLHETDILLVPDMFWQVTHNFTELEGSALANTRYTTCSIAQALQTVQFRLDRSGAVLSSQAPITAQRPPREFVFDRPFLVYIKRRDAQNPFFVMWVDNAELLTKR